MKAQVSGQDLNDKVGRELFQKFEEVSLVKRHRATDPHYATAVSSFREWTPSALKTHMDFLDTVSEITRKNSAIPLGNKPQLLAQIRRQFMV